ncbi:MAG: hypothetical protein US62_C0019G0021 [Candidatus Woesebacteria bacterium GW2011_GWA1_37_8]|uniref:Uncharacterized protein n=2 Tax=Candidatus Woeseibacteriota TaxID=1752722 RepID=A0A0G0PAG8_9BACT|nr:MAG: hypothetical protein US39_C0002G0020 [Microgenomates group bacterium GW2011_GWC1_37_12b]KKQ44989.1 MAG: hypothetical protein US62_C0019G0021 [Candidatus Woesebacteria bacterium GW2011_GWA1_37_8]KKQ86306.1 MAG: hypothetical protein UT10_C0030G0006 [Candidatus Woesebacteria bacterium GW2011_GWB1_38_8b]
MSDDNNQLNTAVTPTPNPVGGNVSDSTTSVPAQAATSTTNTVLPDVKIPDSSPQTNMQQDVTTPTTSTMTNPFATPQKPVTPTDVTTVVTSPHAPQKYGGRKVLATIFGVLLIVGGVAAGVLLVQRQQNISERAQTNVQYDAQCSEVIVYDQDWNRLSLADLNGITSGSVVRFAVVGASSSGNFDKARFTINGTKTPEVTDKKPGTEEFYYQYILPEGVRSYTVKAEIHHTIWGWI